MFSFLQPIWLWASASVIVPVLIHLRNAKPGNTLKVGSIMLFTKSASSHTKSLQITDWLLLLLRCLLLIVLAILLAKPVWKKENTAREKGWILVEKGSVKEAYKAYQSTIDTLLQNGYAFHYFDEGFKKEDIKTLLQKGTDTAHPSSLSYWSLLKLADQRVSSGFPIYLFTGNQVRRFEGNRPEVSLNLTWQLFSPTDTIATWLEKAYLTSADSLCIVRGESNPSGTTYTHQSLSFNNTGSYTVHQQKGSSVLSVTDSLHQTVTADTAALSVAIYEDGFAEDAAYLKAALLAIGKVRHLNMRVMATSRIENIPPKIDWLFWLSDNDNPPLQQEGHLFVYEKGEGNYVRSVLTAKDEEKTTTIQNIQLYKSISSPSSFQTVWQNGFGGPVLTKQMGRPIIYHFYSRFSPQWSDLVWSSSFPQWLYELMFEADSVSLISKAKDRRMIDSSQVQPIAISGKYFGSNHKMMAYTDISAWVWSIAFVLFFAERLLSFKKQKSGQV